MPRVLFLLFLLPLSLFAQKQVNLTVFGGFSNYSGDLQEKQFTLDQSHLAVGAGLSYELIPKLLIKAGLAIGKLSADDKYSSKDLNRQRNLNFTSNIYEFNINLEGAYQEEQMGNIYHRKGTHGLRGYEIYVYGFAGAGIFYFRFSI